jgi:hypothetical protein
MPLDSTVAGAAAEAYLSVAEADALAADDFGPERESWLDAGLEDKELVLKRATDEIDDELRSGWLRYASGQALLFPRAIDVASALPVIPERIRRATYFQAAFLLRNATVLAAADTRRARGAQSVSEPNMSYTQPVDGTPAVISSRVLHVIEGFRRAGGARGIQAVRMSSGYIP